LLRWRGEDWDEVIRVGDEVEVDEAAVRRIRDGVAGPFAAGHFPLEVGGACNGVLVTSPVGASAAVVEPALRLLSLAIERERLLAEAARLEAVRASDEMKTSLLRAVSHDLRTPLTAMGLEIESLGAKLPEAAPGAEASLLSLAREHQRLARRIDNLLSLARLEAGVSRPHPEPVPAAALLRDAVESLRLQIGERPCDLAAEPFCPDVLVDPALGLEVVVNLVENAVRASPGGARLELAAREGPPGRVWIEVRDRGPGLPGAVRRRLAQPAGAAGRREPVAGLGLEIAGSLTALNGGSLVFLDRPGGGTVARLELPAAVPVPALEAGA
jgi:two-component system sensor histidine kinase KdpD